MVSPQKENGYIPIANEIMDVLIKADLTAGELKLILSVLRKTWGWNKKEDWISLSQLEEMTGFSHWYVSKIKKQLINRRILKLNENKLTFNKIYTDWVVSCSLPLPVSPSLPPLVSYRTTGSKLENNLPVSCSLHTKDTITKDINTKDNIRVLEKNLKLIKCKLHKKLI